MEINLRFFDINDRYNELIVNVISFLLDDMMRRGISDFVEVFLSLVE